MMQLSTRTTRAAARQGAAWPALWVQAGLLLLAACAVLGPADHETSRIYQNVAPNALYDRAVRALQASDLEIIEADRASGMITAAGRFDQRNWAVCPDSLMLINDQGGTGHMIDAPEDHRTVELRAAVIDTPQGARLTLDPAFLTEPVSAMATTEECGTTGVLEEEILESVAAQA